MAHHVVDPSLYRKDFMTEELTLEEWLTSTAPRRQELLDYSRSKIPTDHGERQLDVSKALENGQDAGDLLADVEVYLSQELAKETLAAREKHDAQTAKVVALGKVSQINRLRNGLAVLYRTLTDRRFALMNLNRSGV